ncbi:CDP-glycerol glycerophosphotransferase family protein [Pseudomonas sp. PDM22]|uniref:CDP-glycerol glycerophosphotransferase family protein n=1 Tax=Pseudomonas sp. PDM22 TaxID=2769287 RepID=UPI0009D9C3D1|nr:CDP-glycerol glycerophosphotransferase family protein [Pseudomonas sp. PDM22]MBD9514024.1 CDP-glycerol glycerophosphotransferase family protein [Pseudomonas sp. PDM22]OQR35046.1 hypothetical protein BWR15_13950 [Pseudomonas sp. T]
MKYEKFYRKSNFQKLSLLLLSPLAWASQIIPKNNEIEIYSSMNGYRISDNSKYAFLHSKNKSKYWITKNKSLLRKHHPEILYAYSIKGIIIQLRACRAYYSHSIFDFAAPLIMGSEKFNLWHGVPLKEIGPPSDWKNKSTLKKKLLTAYYRIFKHCYYMHCDYILCPQESLIRDYERFFSVSRPKIIIQPQPRNTYCTPHISTKEILFAPTHRMQIAGSDINKVIEESELFSNEVREFLKSNEITIVIRPHPVDKDNIKSIESESYRLDFSDDLYDSIKKYSLIITDYSSIYYDCKDLNIPRLIIASDAEDYIDKVGVTENYIKELKSENLLNFRNALPHIKNALAG